MTTPQSAPPALVVEAGPAAGPIEFVVVTSADSIAIGGMKNYRVNGRELVLCNTGTRFYAVARRCGHMNAPLELGTLDGTIVTCPMHCAQFDVATGEALCGPVPQALGNEVVPKGLAKLLGEVALYVNQVATEDVLVYEAKVEAGQVLVAVPRRGAPHALPAR
jgi:nitrite reductase/ring-hydroxylating ferredoxin subunit